MEPAPNSQRLSIDDGIEIDRRCTDTNWILALSIYLISLLILTICTLNVTDVKRIVLEFEDYVQESAVHLHIAYRLIIILLLLPMTLSFIVLLLFRYLADFIIWVILLGILITSVLGTIYLTIHYLYVRGNELLIYVIIMAMVTIGICIALLVLRVQIQLVAKLFAEAGKAIGDMPYLLCQPFILFIVFSGVFFAWLFIVVIIESVKVPTTVLRFTRVYNFFFIIWIPLLLLDCQNMILAGAVCRWFFTRDKSQLKSPIMMSYSTLVHYHFGTVIFGSLIMAILKYLRLALQLMEKIKTDHHEDESASESEDESRCCKCCACCGKFCVEIVTPIIRMVTHNAYIVTALHGYPFCRAAQRAFAILKNNPFRLITINSVGDFVLIFTKILIVIITLLISREVLQLDKNLPHRYISLLIIAIFSYFIATCFMSVYEMVIDSIFICFCEDCELNDGRLRPYFMSPDLMSFVEYSSNNIFLR